jgi:hypothetical protein
MSVVAAIQAAQPLGLQAVRDFLWRNEDRLVIAALFVVIATTTAMTLLANVAMVGGPDTGVCVQRTHSFPGYPFPTLH